MNTPANDDTARAVRIVRDEDLRAYVEDRLSQHEEWEVEGFLACNPDVAARVMTERHMRRSVQPRSAMRQKWPKAVLPAIGFLACLASGAMGWAIATDARSPGWREVDGDKSPAYVDEAMMSVRATLIRAGMASQPETPVLDGAEVSRALGLRLPLLPRGWRLLDVQVFPSDDGPGLNLVAQAPDGRRLNLFVVRADTNVTDEPVIASRGRERVVYWEEREAAFVLSGDGSERQLLEEAAVLAQS